MSLVQQQFSALILGDRERLGRPHQLESGSAHLITSRGALVLRHLTLDDDRGLNGRLARTLEIPVGHTPLLDSHLYDSRRIPEHGEYDPAAAPGPIDPTSEM